MALVRLDAMDEDIKPADSFHCPHCLRELDLPEDAWYVTCDHCGARLDLKSQFAFLRGMDAFEEGQELMVRRGPRKRRNKTRENEIYREVVDLFVEAYTSLQVAFAAKLGAAQRQVGVEMMSSMSAEFFNLSMISPFELAYWSNVMTEQRAQLEYDRLQQQARGVSGLWGQLKFLRWRLRLGQLRKKLPELSSKLDRLEQQIEFIDPPHARNRKWKP